MDVNLISGIDCPFNCTRLVDQIRSINAKFVGRYYRPTKSKWPSLTLSEARAISSAGLDIITLWENESDSLARFSFSAGEDDGMLADKYARSAGQPVETPIYFTVDFDCSKAQISGALNDYFRGVAAGLNTAGAEDFTYDIGVYGSGEVCSWLLEHNRVSHTWLAQSTGWGGYKGFAGWNIRQRWSKSKPFDHDLDEARPGCGFFRVTQRERRRGVQD